ncbi:segmentation protein cap'n'collar isoform X7 [Vespula squamosa]|uniref:Segmentation protein cap'n'collar isoform X7 n=1 Tax=Vespula squamosa TaxID=30214 RepID=A0ABD2B2D1_VESSQ
MARQDAPLTEAVAPHDALDEERSSPSLGEYILSSCSQNGNSDAEDDDHLLREESFGLDHHPLAGLSDDSLGLSETLGLEDDFTSELLSDSLLGSAVVEDLLGDNDLGLPDGFNLEEALQLVGLDEAQPEDEETKSEVKKEKEEKEIKKEEEEEEEGEEEEDGAKEFTSAKGDVAVNGSSNVEVAKSSRCEDPETGDMIHTPQFHHPHHPHHRSFQVCSGWYDDTAARRTSDIRTSTAKAPMQFLLGSLSQTTRTRQLHVVTAS